MIVSWISHDNRKQRRTKRSRARRAGRDLAIYRVTTEEIGQHIVALTVYLSSPSKARLDELVALERARQHVIHYIGSQKGEDESVSEVEIEAAREMATRERVRQILTRNLLSTELDDIQFEMAAVTGLSPGGEDPIEHIVLSWPEGEHPTEAQVEEALDILLAAVGMSRHQAYAVLHTDTPNDHLHVALNRIDPVSSQRLQIGLNLERSIETLHQAVSNIEYRQGWKPQANALYRADDTGVYDRATGAKVRDAAMQPCASHADQKRIRSLRALEKFERKISSPARDYERRTGFESLQRRVIETAGPICKDAERWHGVHRGLATEGMRYHMLADGAVIECGDRTIAASAAWGGASAAKMIERLGPFEAPESDVTVVPFHDRAIPNLCVVVEKRRARDAVRQARQGLADSIALASDMIGDRYARRVAEDPRSATSELNDVRRDASVELGPLKRAIDHLLRRQRERLRRERKKLAKEKSAEPVVDDELDTPVGLLVGIDAGPAPLQRSDAVLEEGFRGIANDDHVAYYRDSQLVFVEHSDRIDLHATDDAAIRQALHIGAAKWGPVVGIGDQRFLDRLARIAVEEGIELTNPELQSTLERLHREREANLHAAAPGAMRDAAPIAAPPVLETPDIPAILRDYAPQFTEWIELRADKSTTASELQKCAVAITTNLELARQLAELESQQFAFAKELRRSARIKRRLNALDFLERDDFFFDEHSTSIAEELPSFPGHKRSRAELEEFITFAPVVEPVQKPTFEIPREKVADQTLGGEKPVEAQIERAPVETNVSDATDLYPVPLVPVHSTPVAATLWTLEEQRYRDQVASKKEHDIKQIDRWIDAAIAQRVGKAGSITRYAARLLSKIAGGFDPEGVSPKIGPVGHTRDQGDAAEIITLARLPSFAARIEAAKQRDPELLKTLASASERGFGAHEFLSSVGIENDRLQVDTAAKTVSGARRTPLGWAEQMLPSIIKQQIPLTRHNGLVGIYDDEVLKVSKENFVGLLHPTIQAALDVEERLQRERKLAIFAQIQSGALKIRTSIKTLTMSDRVMTQVWLMNGTPQENFFVYQRSSDADFYFQCREAKSANPSAAPTLRHDNIVVRAWLKAREEDASVAVLTLLANKVKKEKDDLIVKGTTGMSDPDARALASLLNPPPRQIQSRPRRGGPRGRPPNQPGRR